MCLDGCQDLGRELLGPPSEPVPAARDWVGKDQHLDVSIHVELNRSADPLSCVGMGQGTTFTPEARARVEKILKGLEEAQFQVSTKGN